MPLTVGHVKNLTQGDATGTVTVFNTVGSTVTAAATALLRPADWNSAHAVTFTPDSSELVKWFAKGATSVSSGVLNFTDGNGVSFLLSSATNGQHSLFASVGGTVGTRSQFMDPPVWASVGNITATNNSVSVKPLFIEQPLAMSAGRILASISANTHTSASTNTYGLTIEAMLYSRTGNTLSSIVGGSGTYSGTWSTNGTGSVAGVRALTFPMATTLQPGLYFMGLRMSTSSSNASMGASVYVGAQGTAHLNPGVLGAATAASQVLFSGQGIWSTTSGALPASIDLAAISGSGTFGSRGNVLLQLFNQAF